VRQIFLGLELKHDLKDENTPCSRRGKKMFQEPYSKGVCGIDNICGIQAFSPTCAFLYLENMM
jgi:hypothetical protein